MRATPVASTVVAIVSGSVVLGSVVSGCADRDPSPAAHSHANPAARLWALPSPTSSPSSSATTTPTARASYLALGDSIAFGSREPQPGRPANYRRPATFVGYPEDVGRALGYRVVNVSCPGETSASLIRSTAPSDGCENAPTKPVGYRTRYPLHRAYPGSQLDFATAYLQRHPLTRLVTVQIGVNDVFRCFTTTHDGCAAEMRAVARGITRNVNRILARVRATGYAGPLVVVDYYSFDYANARDDRQARLVNGAMDAAAWPWRAQIADGYRAFERAARAAGGNTCQAGLLTVRIGGGCGIHPSSKGHRVLAAAVVKVVHAARR